MEVCESAVIKKLCEHAESILDELELPVVESAILKDLKNQLRQLEQISRPNSAILSAVDEIKQQIRQEEFKTLGENQNIENQKSDLLAIFQDTDFWDTFLSLKLSQEEYRQIFFKFVSKVWIHNATVVKIDLR
jgi:hypothetical protein